MPRHVPPLCRGTALISIDISHDNKRLSDKRINCVARADRRTLHERNDNRSICCCSRNNDILVEISITVAYLVVGVVRSNWWMHLQNSRRQIPEIELRSRRHIAIKLHSEHSFGTRPRTCSFGNGPITATSTTTSPVCSRSGTPRILRRRMTIGRFVVVRKCTKRLRKMWPRVLACSKVTW